MRVLARAPRLQHHCYMAYGDPEAATANQIAVYGLPTTLEDYCIKAQLANYVQVPALACPQTESRASSAPQLQT